MCIVRSLRSIAPATKVVGMQLERELFLSFFASPSSYLIWRALPSIVDAREKLLMPDPPSPAACPVCNSTVGFLLDGSCEKCERNARVAVLYAQIQAIQDSSSAPDTTTFVPFVDTKPTVNDGFAEDISSLAPSSRRYSGASAPYYPNTIVPSAAAAVARAGQPRTSAPLNPSTISVVTSQTSFVPSILQGSSSLVGAGSELRNLGIQFVKVWGLAGADTPLPISELTFKQLSTIPALVPKNLFADGADLRAVLEEQSLFRSTFNSDSMQFQLPLFLFAVGNLKKSYRLLVRDNMRQGMLDTARRCLSTTGYVPLYNLRSFSELSAEFGRNLPGPSAQWMAWSEVILSTHTTHWGIKFNKKNLDILTAMSMEAMGLAYRLCDQKFTKKGCFRVVSTRVFHDCTSWLKDQRSAMTLRVKNSSMGATNPISDTCRTNLKLAPLPTNVSNESPNFLQVPRPPSPAIFSNETPPVSLQGPRPPSQEKVLYPPILPFQETGVSSTNNVARLPSSFPSTNNVARLPSSIHEPTNNVAHLPSSFLSTNNLARLPSSFPPANNVAHLPSSFLSTNNLARLTPANNDVAFNLARLPSSFPPANNDVAGLPFSFPTRPPAGQYDDYDDSSSESSLVYRPAETTVSSPDPFVRTESISIPTASIENKAAGALVTITLKTPPTALKTPPTAPMDLKKLPAQPKNCVTRQAPIATHNDPRKTNHPNTTTTMPKQSSLEPAIVAAVRNPATTIPTSRMPPNIDATTPANMSDATDIAKRTPVVMTASSKKKTMTPTNPTPPNADDPDRKVCLFPADHHIYREGPYKRETDGRYSHLLGIECGDCLGEVVAGTDPSVVGLSTVPGFIYPTKINPVWVCHSCQEMMLCNTCFLVKSKTFSEANPGRPVRKRKQKATKP